MTTRIKGAEKVYLHAFLKKVGMKEDKIPKTEDTMKKRCITWIEAPKDHRPYILMTIPELKEAYREKHGKPPKSAWGNAKLLIPQIIAPVTAEDTTTRRTNSVIDPSSLEQELMNILVRGLSLKPLEGEAKEHCQKGHEMEKHFSKELLNMDGFPWGTIDEIASVGLVQKDGVPQVKSSVDRLVCVTNNNNEKEIMLTEYKARIKPTTASNERDRVEDLRMRDLMDEEHIFAETSSDDVDSFDFIPDEQERVQVIHHTYTFEKTNCLHAVGDSKALLSCVKFNLSPDLLTAYAQTMSLLDDLLYKHFYSNDTDKHSDLRGSEELMASIENAVEVNKERVVNMRTFQFNYKLWKTATADENLPLPLCRYIVPLMYAWWDAMKPGSDQNTQMLWDANFVTPHQGLHCALVKRMAILQPLYMIHRLGCMLSCAKALDDFPSIKSYRKHISRGKPFWHSIRSVEDDLWAMLCRYNPQGQLPRSPVQRQLQQNQRIVIENPLGIQGIEAVVQKIGLPVTDNTPQRNISSRYSNAVSNVNAFVRHRREHCNGMCLCKPVQAKVGNNDTTEMAPMKRSCAFCEKEGAHVYCTGCHHYFHETLRKLPESEVKLIAIPTGKRDTNDQPVYLYVENNCAHAWHAAARRQSFANVGERMIPQITLS